MNLYEGPVETCPAPAGLMQIFPNCNTRSDSKRNRCGSKYSFAAMIVKSNQFIQCYSGIPVTFFSLRFLLPIYRLSRAMMQTSQTVLALVLKDWFIFIHDYIVCGADLLACHTTGACGRNSKMLIAVFMRIGIMDNFVYERKCRYPVGFSVVDSIGNAHNLTIDFLPDRFTIFWRIFGEVIGDRNESPAIG